jgi:hypothetical protein
LRILAVAAKTNPSRLDKFPAAKQRRLDELLAKNSAGRISPREFKTLERLVAEAELLMVANAKRLADFSQQSAGGTPTNAVPVTVWVAPAALESR